MRAEVAEFLESPRAAPFRADRVGAGDVARAFLDVCYGELAVRPDHLDEEHLREALDLLPARLDPSSKSSQQALAIVRALLDHAFEKRSNANAWKFPALLDEASETFAARLAREGGSGVAPSSTPITRPGSKLGRNDPCPCGSGKKWKKCCGKAS